MAKIQTNTKNQLTDVALAKGWNADQMYREEAKQFTQDFLTKFGVFVGLYNKTNGTVLSVEDALFTESILDLYVQATNLIKNTSNPSSTTVAAASQVKSNVSKKPKSTKKLSYEQFQVENGTSVAHAIYTFLKKQDVPMSRLEIATAMKIRLSTVCGQIHAMAEAGLVHVVGEKIDENSNRTVELLAWR
jgi:hypothetical protein